MSKKCSECGNIGWGNGCVCVKEWHIWSIEHDGWWKPNESGYSKDKKEAGLYTFKRACEIVAAANEYVHDLRQINEAMVKAE